MCKMVPGFRLCRTIRGTIRDTRDTDSLVCARLGHHWCQSWMPDKCPLPHNSCSAKMHAHIRAAFGPECFLPFWCKLPGVPYNCPFILYACKNLHGVLHSTRKSHFQFLTSNSTLYGPQYKRQHIFTEVVPNLTGVIAPPELLIPGSAGFSHLGAHKIQDGVAHILLDLARFCGIQDGGTQDNRPTYMYFHPPCMYFHIHLELMGTLWISAFTSKSSIHKQFSCTSGTPLAFLEQKWQPASYPIFFLMCHCYKLQVVLIPNML